MKLQVLIALSCSLINLTTMSTNTKLETMIREASNVLHYKALNPAMQEKELKRQRYNRKKQHKQKSNTKHQEQTRSIKDQLTITKLRSA